MSQDWQRLVKKVNQRTTDIVNNYIRNCQILFTNHNSSYYNIPLLVTNLIMIYYHQYHHIDADDVGQCLKMNKSSDSILLTCGDGVASAFLKNVMDCNERVKQIYDWKFEIVKREDNGSDVIGIWKTKYGELLTDQLFTDTSSYAASIHKSIEDGEHVGYGFVPSRGQLVLPNGGACTGEQYCEKCQNGDIIEMHLDTQSLSLSFTVNGKCIGKAFDIECTTYRACICLSDPNSAYKVLFD